MSPHLGAAGDDAKAIRYFHLGPEGGGGVGIDPGPVRVSDGAFRSSSRYMALNAGEVNRLCHAEFQVPERSSSPSPNLRGRLALLWLTSLRGSGILFYQPIRRCRPIRNRLFHHRVLSGHPAFRESKSSRQPTSAKLILELPNSRSPTMNQGPWGILVWGQASDPFGLGEWRFS